MPLFCFSFPEPQYSYIPCVRHKHTNTIQQRAMADGGPEDGRDIQSLREELEQIQREIEHARNRKGETGTGSPDAKEVSSKTNGKSSSM